MSTLVIEGGKRVEGRVDVEGNKNAALPLIAACLLTDEWCTLSNMPRISDVEVMARLLLDLGAEVEGIGSTTLRIRCANVTKDDPDSALVGRLPGPGDHRAARRRLPGPPQHQDAPRGAHRHGCPCLARLRPSARSPRWLEADFHLPRRSVGDRHRNGAPGRRRGAGAVGDSSCGL